MREENIRNEENPFYSQVEKRVIYGLLLPAVRLGFMFKVPIKEMGDLLQMAYYHETKRQGLKMREAGDLLDVSMRKVALLSKQLKVNFLELESQHSLPRRIEFMLWANPLSASRLIQAMDEKAQDEILDALELLITKGRVREIKGATVTYEVCSSEARLVDSTWLARLDGLDNVMEVIANTVYGRFFLGEPRAFARTLSLRMRQSGVEQLKLFYKKSFYPLLHQLEEEAKKDEEAVMMDVSLIWAPYSYITNIIKQNGE